LATRSSAEEIRFRREASGSIRTYRLAAALDVGQMGLGNAQHPREFGLGQLLVLSVREQEVGQSQIPKPGRASMRASCG